MTILWMTIYGICLFGSFVNPVFGTVGYLFEYYLRPSLHWWGAGIPDWRWNFLIAAVLTLTFVARRRSLPDIGPAKKGPGICLAGLLLVMVMVYPMAADRELSWDKTVEYSKLILFHGLVVGTVRTPLAFDAVVATHLAGATWWGWEAYTNPKRSAGRLANVGSGDTRGDNGAAAHFLVVIPFAVVYFLVHSDKRLRALSLLALPLTINAFILCNSRGAFLGMGVAAVAAVLLVRTGNRLRMVAAGAALAFALFVLADPQFINRQMNTSYSDGSAQGRLEAWSSGADLIADHPFGTGGQGFWVLSPQYAALLVDRAGERRDPHNTFVLVTSEWGVQGLALFLGYYASTFLLLFRVKRRADQGGIWYYRAVAIQVSLVGFLVAATFTDRLYAEAPYWMGALAVALYRIQSHALTVKEESKAPEVPRQVPSYGALPRPV
jgi:hypothetical protein